ncbi:ER membrane protein complex subunit 9 isoform 1-T2 [Dugong dugon]
MGEVEISSRAYVKMCLHAARYPHVAERAVERAVAGARAAVRGMPVPHSVPLFHSHLALSVMLEVALNQVLGPLALKIAGQIAEFFPDAVLIMVDNQKLVPQPHVPPVIVLENHGLCWAPKDKNLVMWRDWQELWQMVGALLEGQAHQHLVDFDSHLDDIRQNWTNQQLNTQITRWIGPTNGNA